MRSATGYVELAERANGPIRKPVSFSYIWGDALPILQAADACVINLETSITRSDAAWPEKRIHYRMHPDNVACLQAASVDCCVLANNHVLDWGRGGLEETLVTLSDAGIRTAGAGLDLAADTTDANGVATELMVKPGEYWVHARYEEVYSELYWNVPVSVARGEPVTVTLNRSNAQVRPIY